MPTTIPQNTVLSNNIITTVKEAFVQVSHAQLVMGRARTGYYKVATLLLASATEAALHDIVACRLTTDPSLASLKPTKRHKKTIELKKAPVGTTKELWICELVDEDFKLNSRVMLNELNEFAKLISAIDERVYKDIIYIRNKRNEIHLQGLGTTNRSFTKSTVERTAQTLQKLVSIRDTL